MTESRSREDEGGPDLARYLEVVLRWWWLFLIVPLAVVPVLYLRDTPEQAPQYRTETRILIQSVSPYGIWDLLASQRLPAIYVELVAEKEVLVKTGQRLGLAESPATMRSWVKAKVVPDTTILEIAVTHGDPAMAAAFANALAQEFISHVQETRLGEVGRLQAMASALGIADQGQILSQQLAALGSFTVVRLAEVPLAPMPIKREALTVQLFVALAVAAMAAVALAFALEYLAGKVRSPQKLHNSMGMEPLGVVPGGSVARKSSHQAIVARRPTTINAEAYRQILARLSPFWSGGHGARAVLITSPGPMDGKTTTAVNLAIGAAQSGRRVLLVDGDLWRADVHRWFNLRNDVGLSTLLADPSLPAGSVLNDTEFPNLRVLTSGPAPAAHSMLLEKGAAEQVLAGLKQEAELIVFDSPPMLARSDAFRLASIADGVLVVVDADRTRLGILRKVMQDVQDASYQGGGAFLGLVLNRFHPPALARYIYYRYYGSYYGYYGGYFSRYYGGATRGRDGGRERETVLVDGNGHGGTPGPGKGGEA